MRLAVALAAFACVSCAHSPNQEAAASDAPTTAATLEAEGKGADAVKAYSVAAHAGRCEAARRIGQIYDRGLLGVSQDLAESLKWYYAAQQLGCEVPGPRPAADQLGPKPAARHAAMMKALTFEAEGKGPEAIEAYRNAARTGNCDSVRRLGEIYEKGLIGIPRDPEQSLKWYNFARMMGCAFPPEQVIYTPLPRTN